MDELTQRLDQLRRSMPPSELTVEVIMHESRRRRHRRAALAVGASIAAVAAAIGLALEIRSDRGDELPPAVTVGSVTATTFARVGGAFDDSGMALVDRGGQLIVAGSTTGKALVATPGALSLGSGGNSDVFVSKLNSEGSVEWTARLGASGDDEFVDAAIDGEGRVVVLMHNVGSASDGLARTSNAYGERFGGPINVARLSRDGRTLDFLAAIGGHGEAFPRAMTLERDGSIIIVGTTNMSDFGADDGGVPAPLAFGEAFVAKLSADGERLIVNEVFGGTGSDVATGVDIAPDGTIVAAGATTSRNFPTTEGVAHPTSNFDAEGGFVVGIDPSTGTHRWSTYVNDAGFGYVNDVAVDPSGDVVVVGDTYGDNGGFPVTSGSFDVAPVTSGHGAAAHFVARLSADGSRVRWASYIGRWDAVREYSSGVAVAIGPSGSIIVTGDGDDSDGGLRVTTDAVQPDFGGGTRDALVAVVSGDGTTLHYATYLGGGGEEGAGHPVLGRDGETWLAVDTDTPSWLKGVSAGPTRGGGDVVVVRLTGL